MYVQYVHDACMHGIALYRTAFSRLYFSFLTSQKIPVTTLIPYRMTHFVDIPFCRWGF